MFKTSEGNNILLENEPFAQGVEGKLFRITAPAQYASTHLVKIYHPYKLTAERQQKLHYLIENPPTDLVTKDASTVIWPEALLYDEQKELIGFIVRLVKGEKLELLSRNKLPKGMDKSWWRFDLQHRDAWDLRLRLGYYLSVAVMHIIYIGGSQTR